MCTAKVIDVEVVYIPKKIVEEIRNRGLDLQELVLKILKKELGLDPQELAEARVEIAEKILQDAKKYIEMRDVVQASEKLYKAVEECIKALAEVLKVPQLEEVEKRGKWDTWLLGRAATDLSKILREDRIRLAWANAYDIHVWGFHEVKYRIEDVEAALPLAEWLLNYTRQVIREIAHRSSSLC